jgi:hypothetical protein
MESVQMFKTSDGKLFDSKESATSHEAGIQAQTEMKTYQAALVAAGFSKEQAGGMVRGAKLFTVWSNGGAIPTPKKRVVKGA